jgi:hypothetical protein
VGVGGWHPQEPLGGAGVGVLEEGGGPFGLDADDESEPVAVGGEPEPFLFVDVGESEFVTDPRLAELGEQCRCLPVLECAEGVDFVGGE